MMTIEEFTTEIEKEFEDVEPGTITPDTNYREIKSWSSMYALIVIAFVDANFDVELNADDLRNSQSIRDIYNIVAAKKQA
ncbi:MAG: acyl carrier protein [Bacteroidia bacterium]|jgi:acyl carrier protein|nr:acyl carrier protein [Bacteroidia bacterium]